MRPGNVCTIRQLPRGNTRASCAQPNGLNVKETMALIAWLDGRGSRDEITAIDQRFEAHH
jgi:hypothetical protein